MKILLVFLLLCLCGSSDAQKFFKRFPDPPGTDSLTVVISNALRPIAKVGSIFLPGTQLVKSMLFGCGVSYQRLKFKSREWASVWTASFLVWCKASLAGDINRLSIGITCGLWNDLLLVGVATDFGIFFGTIGIGINFNN